MFSPGSHPHARHHHGTPSSSSPETVRSHPIHYRAPSSPSEGYISLPYESFSAVQSGVTDSDADTRKHYGYYRRRGRPQLIWTPSDNCKYMHCRLIMVQQNTQVKVDGCNRASYVIQSKSTNEQLFG